MHLPLVTLSSSRTRVFHCHSHSFVTHTSSTIQNPILTSYPHIFTQFLEECGVNRPFPPHLPDPNRDLTCESKAEQCNRHAPSALVWLHQRSVRVPLEGGPCPLQRTIRAAHPNLGTPGPTSDDITDAGSGAHPLCREDKAW